MRILIADDSQIILRLLQSSLQADGIELVSLRSATEALAQLEGPNPPALAILDWQMPDLSGLEICRRVRTSQKTLRPHLMLLSVCSGKEDQIEALGAGADEFISKPFDKDLLLARVQAAIRGVIHQNSLIERLEKTAATAGKNGDVESAPEAAVVSTGAVIIKSLSNLYAPDQVQSLVDRTLADMGFGEATSTNVRAETNSMRAEMDLVHFMILPEKSLWLDLLLETNMASAGTLFRTFTGMDDSGVPTSDLVDAIGETLNMIQGNLKAEFKSKGTELIVPLVPQAIPCDRVEARCSPTAIYSRSLHRVGDMVFRFTLFAYPSPLQRKHLTDISRSDVLAEALRPADDSDIVLINRGTLMTNRFLKKVENLSEMSPRNYTTPVYEPSPLTALLSES